MKSKFNIYNRNVQSIIIAYIFNEFFPYKQNFALINYIIMMTNTLNLLRNYISALFS